LSAGWSSSWHWDWLSSGSWKTEVSWDHLDSSGVSTETGGSSHIWGPDWVLPHGDDSWLGLLNNDLLFWLALVEADFAGSVSVTVTSGVVSASSTSLAWSLFDNSILKSLTLGEVVSSKGLEEGVAWMLVTGIGRDGNWSWLVAWLLVSITAATGSVSLTISTNSRQSSLASLAGGAWSGLLHGIFELSTLGIVVSSEGSEEGVAWVLVVGIAWHWVCLWSNWGESISTISTISTISSPSPSLLGLSSGSEADEGDNCEFHFNL
jgi:hypothetical protein